MDSVERVYLIRPPNAVRVNTNVYKLYRTTCPPKNCEVVLITEFAVPFIAERELLCIFRNKYVCMGTKHFRGDSQDMMLTIFDYIYYVNQNDNKENLLDDV
jgi:hypothetical protein